MRLDLCQLSLHRRDGIEPHTGQRKNDRERRDPAVLRAVRGVVLAAVEVVPLAPGEGPAVGQPDRPHRQGRREQNNAGEFRARAHGQNGAGECGECADRSERGGVHCAIPLDRPPV